MKDAVLLTRDAFREAVFARDQGRCVICGEPATDAHHILERRLWPDGGYYLENGASVCAVHHLVCETTDLSVEEIRQACGITRTVLPPQLYPDQRYDKWGNPILANGQRWRGELWGDVSVQKILRQGSHWQDFTYHTRYPRTSHFPWSERITSDDRVLSSWEALEGRRVVTTEKMDGENTTLYREGLHARSLDSRSHPSRDWVKQWWSQIRWDIPEGWRICGENLYARHEVAYDDLPTYFLGFSLWTDRQECLSWDDTLEWFELLGVTPVPVVDDGIWETHRIRHLASQVKEDQEGLVTRIADSFAMRDFRSVVGKFVRAGFDPGGRHWQWGRVMEINHLRSRDPE